LGVCARVALPSLAAFSASCTDWSYVHLVNRAKSKAEQQAIERVRRICLALPEATEKLAWGEPTFRAGKIFAMMDTHHHGAGHVAVVVPAELGAQETLVAADPERFFVPPYVGVQGWIGARIDRAPDWEAIEGLIKDAYRMIAPPRLVALFDRSAPKRPAPRRKRRG
jgi:hypothetical protein